MSVDETTVGDPAITSATVIGGKTIHVGSRVKHWGQRYTGCATATVIGFRHEPGSFHKGRPWIKVLVEHDEPNVYDRWDWDWDRTEVAPDIGRRS